MEKKEQESMDTLDYLWTEYAKEKKHEARIPYMSSLLWAVIVAAIIFFLDIRWINYIALIYWAGLVATSVILKEKGLFLFKIVLSVGILAVYFLR